MIMLKKMLPSMLFTVLGLAILFAPKSSEAQFASADIAFTTINCDAPDDFSFVLLRAVSIGEQISFTDQGWLAPPGGFNGTETTITLTFITNYNCGMQIFVNGTNARDETSASAATVTGTALNLSGLGDQIFAYDPANPPTSDANQSGFVAAIQNNGAWDADALSGTTSAQPSFFTDGVNSISINPEQDNAQYNCSVTSGDAATVLGPAIFNLANWNSTNAPAYATPAPCVLSCAAACTDPTVPTLVATPSTICPGGSSTITITGTLNDATDWEVYTTSCGVGSHGNTSTGSYSTGALGSTTTFFIRGEGGCVTPGSCASVTVTVQDITDPVITVCAPTPPNISANGSCQGTATDLTGGVTATDNCTASPTITQSPIAGSTLGLGTTTITLTATDGSGNTATCTVNQTVVDDTDPVITVCAPTPPNISANGSCQGTATDLTGGVTATDNCTGSPTITQSPIAGSTLGLGTTTITLTATDGSGNTATCTVNQTVVDDTDPVITVCAPTPPNISANASCQGTATDLTGGVTATDNCTASPTITQSPTAGSTLGLGTTTITLTATDGSGNTATCTVNQTVIDDTDPVITVCAPTPPNISANGSCQGTATDLTGGVTATDNCTGSPTITQSPIAGSTLGLGTTTITLTATDGSGNTATCTVNQTVVDDTDPVITVCAPTPPNISANASCQGTATDLTGGVTATDNCTGSPTITQSPIAGSTLGLGTTTITLTATDGSGNTATCTVNQTVIDDTDPVITCPGTPPNITANASCQGTAVDLTAGASATDNCTGSPVITQSPAVGATLGLGTTTFTLTATDGSGNTATCTVNQTVVDNTAPSITCPANDNVPGDASCQAILADYTGAATASDNCTGSPTVTQSPVAGTTITGAQVVTLTATDGAGNTSDCTFNVTVTDATAPTAVCQDVNIFVDAGGNASIVAADIDGGSTDNCGGVTLSASQTAFVCTDLGMSANDMLISGVIDGPLAGGTPKAIEFYVVRDIPDLSQYGFGSANNGGGSDGEEFTFPAVAATAGQFIYVASEAPNFTTFMGFAPDYTHGTAPLINGDDAIELFFSSAVIDVFGDINVDGSGEPWDYLDGWAYRIHNTGNDGNTFVLGNWYFSGINALDGETDNATAATPFPTAHYAVGGPEVHVVTLTVTDGSGNTADCSANVTVNDVINPTITCPGNQNETPDASCQFVLVDYTGLATAADNCTTYPYVTQSPVAGTTITGTTTITLTATDAAGNTADCTFDVQLTDITPPSITCPGNTNEVADASCDVSLPDYTGTATVADNCDASPVVTQSPAAGTTISGAGTVVTVTLTATDASGNTSDCTFDVTVVDNTAPGITCPGNTNENADASCDVSLPDYTGAATVADNCDASPVVTQSPAAGTTISGAGTVQTVTLTVTDASGNTADCTFDVTVVDNTAPSITCPGNTNENADANCEISLADYTGAVTVSDNCDASPVVTQAPPAGTTISGAGTVQTVTLTATDASGNTSDCSFDVTVVDNTAPTAVCQNITAFLDGAGNVTITAGDVDGGSTDNCGAVTLSASPTAFTCADIGANNVTLTVTDGSGNTASCVSTVTVSDTVSPTITCPGNQIENFDISCQFTLPDYTSLVTATDNCGGSPTVVQSPPASTVISGNTTITMTVTDGSGNTSNCTFDVVPNDATPPVITCPGNQAGTADATCMFSLPDYTSMATATDNCGVPTVTQVPAPGTMVGLGITNVVLTADDGVNTANCNFDVDVTDVTAPTIVCPGNTNENADASCDVSLPDYTGAATVADNCDASPVVTQSPAPGTTLSGAGTIQTVTLTVTDASGNTADCTFDVTVVDNTAPSITCPGNTNEVADGNCDVTLADYTGAATVSDNCDALPVVTQSPAAGTTLSGAGTVQTVTLTATDASGNTSDCTFDVTVVDNTAPTISCPGNTTENADASCDVSLPDYTGTATVADNCDASPVVTQSPAPGTTISGAGTVQTVTLTVTDASGNTADCTFDMTVVDNTPPVPTCLGNQIENFDISCQFILPNYATAIAVVDNCDASPTVVQSPVPGTVISGVTTITMTATDASGNTSDCTFDVIPNDATPPVITCPGTQTETADATCMFSLGDYTSLATATDNCGTPTVTQVPAPGTMVGLGITNITLTADDGVNTADCNFDVDVIDATAPTITCPANDNVPGDASCDVSLADYTGMATVVDNCDPTPVVTQSPAPGTILNGAGTVQTVTLTVTDASGNTADCTFDVTVIDNTAPTISCPANATETADASCMFSLADYTGMATVADNCDASPVVTQSPAAATMIGMGVTTVTLTVTDASGNTADCTFDVDVQDNTAPSITCANDTVAADANCEALLADYTTMVTIADNCDVSPVAVQVPAAGTLMSGSGTTTSVTITVTDASGNTSDCTFDVLLADSAAPAITCPGNDTVTVNANCEFTLADYTGLVTMTDNCDASPTLTQSPAAATLQTGLVTVTMTATDADGNTSSCTFDVVPDDTTPPTITCPGDITTCNPNVTYTIPVGTDNCSGATTAQTDVTGLSSGSTFPVGTTTLEYTVTDGAGNTAVCTFDVTVQAGPSAMFTYIATGFGSFDFIPNYQSGTASYSWDFGDATSSSLMMPTKLYNTNGDYVVCLSVVENGCKETWCDTISVSTDIFEYEDYSSFIVYPNPFMGITNINFNLMKKSDVAVRVFNYTGKLVAELANGTQPAGEYKYEFNADSHAEGVYMVQLVVNDKVYMKRVVLMK
jgi:hypothetical protein